MQLGGEVPRPSINVLMFWINVGFWENATYSSPKLTLTLTSRLGQNVGFGEG